MANFGQNTTEMIPNIPVGRNGNGPFYLNSEISGFFGIMESTQRSRTGEKIRKFSEISELATSDFCKSHNS